MNSFPFTTQEALGLLSIPAPSNGYIKCPYCMSSGKPLHWEYETTRFRCNKNPEHHGNILTFYRDMTGLPDCKEAFKDICNRLGRDVNDVVTIQYQSKKREPEKETVDYVKRDKVNRAILRCFKLSSKNKTHLLNRGFLEDELNKTPYVTLPDEMDFKEKLSLVERLGFDDYEGVPPFYVSKKGNWFVNFWRGGILVPYYNINNLLVAFQIRVDDDKRKEKENGELESKYIFPTSRDKNHGTASEQCIGYWCHFITREDGTQIINIKNGVMTIIEGGMKGNLYFNITDVPTMTVPGVNCLEIVKRELPVLRELGVYRIQLGWDMDRVMNLNVWEALLAIKKLIESYGIEAPIMEWSNEVVYFNGVHDMMDCDTTFVFTKETFLKLLEEEQKYASGENLAVKNSDTPIERHFARMRKVGVEQVFFAVKNSAEAKEEETRDLGKKLMDLCRAHNVPCTPVFWELKLKGLDDKYAYEMRGIIPR